MADEGVVEATWTEAKAHPWLIGGAVVALVAFMWWAGRSKAPADTPQHFSFSYGPSDAQVRAGTALQIAQQADQTQLGLAQIGATTSLGLAGIDAGTQTTTAKDYFDYLTTSSNNNATIAFNNDYFGGLANADRDQASIVNNQIMTAAQLQMNAQHNDLIALLSSRNQITGATQ